MKAALGFILGLLLFSAGMHGRLGSLLAAVIDPEALQETAGYQDLTNPNSTDSANASNGSPFGYSNPGQAPKGSPPTVAPKSGTHCPPGYYYNPGDKTCHKIGNISGF